MKLIGSGIVVPGNRPVHTLIPEFLTHDGAPGMAFGAMDALDHACETKIVAAQHAATRRASLVR